ncbi:heterodimeric geranylgeranyl pyrophosphate synthase small subunit, chloroplastic-like [Mercurialis annua]|uniref:heterodimeric geranylgeranyl pyrophosphate synthase small subunit, chloroplastic-like n=1 Tax=Mercurialis annua TaxID=3986 RepID=UPI00215FAC82|nr:heterodimeric geranylgeranyl pyrophosphate synthase small subunit, chloroplastic-like [Mercurialis annua]
MAGVSPYTHRNPMARRVFSLSVRNPPLDSYRPFVFSMSKSGKVDYWTSINADIDAHLKQAISIRPPVTVFEPMHHLTFAAPESSAPALCIAACELVGGSRDWAMAAASAIHLMYAAAFTHENLPLTDQTNRNCMLSTHKFGPNVELLTGDGMIPFGFELLSKMNDPAQNNPDRVLRAIIEISRAMGSQGMIEGRYNELQYDESFPEAWLQRVCAKKEGSLHACAAACGAILGGGNEEDIEKLRRYGVYVGMIQGIYNKVERNEVCLKEVNKLKKLALKELKDFDEEKIKAISSVVDDKFCHIISA